MTPSSSWDGRAWVFGDDVDTDVMLPGAALRLPPEEGVPLMFGAVRPGFASLVAPGDVLVGGRNFGTGSSLPLPTLPPLLTSIITAGGLIPQLRRDGYLPPAP